MDKRLQELMEEFKEALNTSLAESDKVAAVVAKIKASGYDVFIVLEATVGFNEIPKEDVKHDKHINAADRRLLKSMRILG
jgi:hypothetical protein